MEPFEVSYTTTGRKGKKVRNVIGVLCPTVLAQRMGLARPIFVSLGDVIVDWSAPQSEAYRAMFDTPNVELRGRPQLNTTNEAESMNTQQTQETNPAAACPPLSVGLGVNEYNHARQEYDRLSAPYLKMKADIYGLMEIAFLVRSSGEMERIERPTFEQIDALNNIDEMLRYLQAACFTPNVKVRGSP